MTLFLLTFVGRLKNTFTRTNYFYRVRLIPRSEILAGAEYRMGIPGIPLMNTVRNGLPNQRILT